ncbi:hypothetical protein LguiA_002779 [Lonicera macranthoides]
MILAGHGRIEKESLPITVLLLKGEDKVTLLEEENKKGIVKVFVNKDDFEKIELTKSRPARLQPRTIYPHGFVSGSSRPAFQGVTHPGIALAFYSLNFGVLMASEASEPPKGLVDVPGLRPGWTQPRVDNIVLRWDRVVTNGIRTDPTEYDVSTRTSIPLGERM